MIAAMKHYNGMKLLSLLESRPIRPACELFEDDNTNGIHGPLWMTFAHGLLTLPGPHRASKRPAQIECVQLPYGRQPFLYR